MCVRAHTQALANGTVARLERGRAGLARFQQVNDSDQAAAISDLQVPARAACNNNMVDYVCI